MMISWGQKKMKKMRMKYFSFDKIAYLYDMIEHEKVCALCPDCMLGTTNIDEVGARCKCGKPFILKNMVVCPRCSKMYTPYVKLVKCVICKTVSCHSCSDEPQADAFRCFSRGAE